MYDEASNSFVPVKITVKEFSNEENKRIYSVEAIDIETQKKPAGQLVSDSKKNGITPITDFDANIQQLIELAKNTSKVVDENGEPKVVYHQTNSTIYRNVETGENWDDLDWREKQEWEERDDWDDYWQEEDFYTFNRNNARTTVEFDGFFFAPEYDEYHGYGKRTIEAFLNIRKPASQEDYNIDSQYNDAGRKERIRLQENGYDGVIRTEGNEVWEYVAFEPNQIKSATDNIGTFDVNEDDISFSIIGEKGASALDRADEATHRMDNLNIAREMETTGKDAKTIRMATGWERGADGKWRYEIGDYSIKEEKIDFITAQLDYKNTAAILLKDLLKDAQGLFVAYPELRNMRVVIKKDSSVIGQGELQWYDAVYDRQIVLNDAAIISHFAKSALERYGKADVGIIRIKQGYNPTTKEKFTNEAEKQEALKIYIEMMNEALLDYYRFKSRNKDIATSILTHEIQHAIQFIEGFASGSNIERFADLRGAVLDSINFMTNGDLLKGSAISDSQSLRDALNKTIPYTDISLKDGYANNLQKVAHKYGYDNIDALVDDFENMPSAFEQYHRTAGEVESRNAQKRMDMSNEQRRETLLADTEDVAREDQIFLMENSGISAMGTTVTRRKADIAVKLQGRDVSPTQLKVLDAFTTDANNITIDVVDANGEQRSITLKQGQDNRAGVKHSVLRHYETAKNSYTAEDILLIPQVVEQGERKQDGKKVSYKLDIGGVKYTVTTDIKGNHEEFTNFFTNRKPIVEEQGSSNTANQHEQPQQSVSANEGSDNISPLQENGELFKRGDIYDYKTGDKITMQNVNVALYREHGPYGQALKQNVSFRGVVLGWGKDYQIDAERLNENLDKALIILEEYKEHLTSLKSNATTPAQKVIDEQIAKIDASMDWANQTKENPSLFHERWHNAPFLELLRPIAEEVVNAEFPDNPSVVAQQTAEALGVDIEIDETLPAKGSYNTRTGRIRINPHRHSSPQDIERTILHEVIGHGGLQALTGKHFPKLCQLAYKMMTEAQRADLRSRHGNLSNEEVGALPRN